ncbi:MAG: zinc ribbon domain-containing protein [Anaerolineales bacterium]|nr:zinc ribbon domain-containing protein [Anaerolineales bacterium]
MAVIRCPSCGKPNPEFLDLCQYCDQPLKDAVAGQPPAEGTIRKSLIIRCPNCDKPNPDFLETCQFCATPLKGGAPVAAPTPEAPAPAGESAEAELPDWLQALRGEAVASEGTFVPPASEATHDWEWTGDTGAAASPADDIPDWLKSLQADTTEAAPPPATPAAPAPLTPEPAEAVPDWLAEPAAAPAEPAGDLPDWLRTPTGPLAEAAEPAEAVPDWLPGPAAAPSEPAAPAEPAGDLPDWLKAATGPLPPAEPAPAKPADELPDWLSGGATPAAGDLPDWLKSATGPLGAAGAAAALEPATAGDLPDWLKSATGPLSESAAPPAGSPPSVSSTAASASPFALGADDEAAPALPAEGLPDWLQDLAPSESPAPSGPALSASAPLPAVLPGPEDEPDFLNDLRGTASPVAEEEQPDWLKSLGLPQEAEAPAPATAPLATSGEEEPDWMRALRAESAPSVEPGPAEPEPDWMADLRTTEPSDRSGPAVSPFAAGPAPAAPGTEEPDWLAALRPAAMPESRPASAPGAGADELAQGEMPSWLAAMRPVDIQQPALEPEVDEYQETVGVLAGMRGVLRAEPSVVLPGKSATQVHALAYAEGHVKQAELLAGMLLSDREAAPPAKRRAGLAAAPWERWLVSLILLLGLLVPPFVLQGLFPLPSTLPAETLAAFQALEAAPAGKPVLVAFDYEPSQAGELEPLAEALVGHAVRRGLPIVTLSTGLTGAGVAQETLTRLTVAEGYSETVTHLNLGYLPGGPLGLLQFARFPRLAFRADFAGRDFSAQGGLWAQPVLRGINSLDDFGLVIVISAAPDDARAWLEQTQGSATPLVLAVSAGTAPLVRSYYEAGSSGRLAGLVNGLAGAMQYQRQAGVYREVATETLQLRWEMVGSGLLTVALLLVLGNLFHGVRQALVRSAGRGRGRA